MKRIAAQLLPPVLALALAGGLYAQRQSIAVEDDSSAFHAGVRRAVEALPVRIGDMDSTPQKLPTAAGKLLHPNAHFSRRYMSPTRWVNVILVHCRDSRDMGGHYPPNCYPGSGWTQVGAPVEHVFTLWNRQVPMAEYTFTRTEVDRQISWTIYDFFVLPAGGVVTAMSDVRKASADYRTRPYGAAQIQVIFDSGMKEPERLELLHEVLAPFGPVIDSLQLKKAREGASR